MEEAISAQWSDSHLQIYIKVTDRDNVNTSNWIVTDDTAMENDCSTIFDWATLQILGSSDCVWLKTAAQARQQDLDSDVLIAIDLASDSTIDFNDALYFGLDAAATYYCASWGRRRLSASTIVIPAIDAATDPIPPSIRLTNFAGTIGVCNDLVLDARGTTSMGGRDGIFRWRITHEYDGVQFSNADNFNLFGSYKELDRGLLDKPATYHITLTVTNWYNASSSLNMTVTVEDEPTPRIVLRHVVSW